MSVVGFEVKHREPYQDGASFGDCGAFERIDAVVHYAVDPAHPANSGIVDLVHAERDTDGMVHFSGDAVLVQPVDPDRGRHSLLVEVPNRGRRTVTGSFNRDARVLLPTVEIPPGDGFLFRNGWSIAWCGWQWDVPRSGARMGLDAPRVVDAAGLPVVDWLQLRFQLNEGTDVVALTDQHVGQIGEHTPVRTVNTGDAEARLLVRDELWDEPVELSRDQWCFPDSTHVELEGGFEPGRLYDLVYRSDLCMVVGVGLLAVRDLGGFLRSDSASNPASGAVDHLFAMGQSQCGRFLRTFLHLGINLDERGEQVYDGVLAHIAGGRRGEFNHRLAQPSVQPTPSHGHLPPFGSELLDRQRNVGGMPKVVFTNTSAEYWRGDASLHHTSPVDGSDVDAPDDVRQYLFASTQHGPGSLPMAAESPFGSVGQNSFNIVDHTPLLRATLENLWAWVAEGRPPPPSAVPRIVDGTATTRDAVLAQMRRIPGLGLPDSESLFTIRPIDLGSYPAAPIGEAYPCLVSAVDDDGNEIAGIPMPDVSVPIATYTGWNPRHPATGAPGHLLDYIGSTVSFPVEADAADPRRVDWRALQQPRGLSDESASCC